MENISKIAKLLGEDNEKRLKDAITDLLINQFEDDLANMAEYMCDYEEIFDEVRKEVTSIMKEKIAKAYLAKAETKFNELFGESFGNDNCEAKWEYWAGWMSNHDRRIDDATCSKCGYKHPTIRFGTPDLLQDYCPQCKSKMKKS